MTFHSAIVWLLSIYKTASPEMEGENPQKSQLVSRQTVFSRCFRRWPRVSIRSLNSLMVLFTWPRCLEWLRASYSHARFDLGAISLPTDNIAFGVAHKVVHLGELPARALLTVVEGPHFVDPPPQIVGLLPPLFVPMQDTA